MKPRHDSDYGVPKKILVTAASQEKLPCHVDFPHNSLIALFSCLFVRVRGSVIVSQRFPDKAQNDGDLKFGRHTYLRTIEKMFYFKTCFCKITQTAVTAFFHPYNIRPIEKLYGKSFNHF